MKNVIVRDDGKETNGKLVWNNRFGGWVIQGKKPKNKPKIIKKFSKIARPQRFEGVF